MHILERKCVHVSPGVEFVAIQAEKSPWGWVISRTLRDLNKWREEGIALQEVVRVWEKSEQQIWAEHI